MEARMQIKREATIVPLAKGAIELCRLFAQQPQ